MEVPRPFLPAGQPEPLFQRLFQGEERIIGLAGDGADGVRAKALNHDPEGIDRIVGSLPLEQVAADQKAPICRLPPPLIRKTP
jgi:hypothetical protein